MVQSIHDQSRTSNSEFSNANTPSVNLSKDITTADVYLLKGINTTDMYLSKDNTANMYLSKDVNTADMDLSKDLNQRSPLPLRHVPIEGHQHR